MEQTDNLNYIKGKTLENNVEYLFKTAGFETYKNQFLSKYEIDVLVKIGDQNLIIECKNYQNSILTIRNLIHQWHSKNKIIKADKVILALAGLKIKEDDYNLAKDFNIQIWDEEYLTHLFKLSLDPLDLKKHILENIELKPDIDIATLYRNEITKLIVFPRLKNTQENMEYVFKNFNNWLRKRVRTDLRMNMANLEEINRHIEIFEDTKHKKRFFVFNIKRGESEYWEELKTRLTDSSILPPVTRKKYSCYMDSLLQEYQSQLEYFNRYDVSTFNKRLINARINLLLNSEYDICELGTNQNEIVRVEHTGDLQFKISLKFINDQKANIISWLMTSEFFNEFDNDDLVYSWLSSDIEETALKVYRIFNDFLEIGEMPLFDFYI